MLVAPSLTWIVFSESGRESWHRLFSPEMRAASPAVIDAKSLSKNDTGPMPRSLVLIPAQSAPTEAALRVQVGNQAVTQQHDKLLVGLVVTDPQGRRSGIDTFNNTVHREIPHSSAERRTGLDSSGNESETIVVTVKPAASTTYSLAITGKPGGDYRLAVGGVSPALQSITAIVQDRAIADTSVHYRVDLTKIKSLPFPGRGGMTARVENPSDAFLSQPETRVKVSSYESLPEICQRVYRKLSQVDGGHLEKNSGFTFNGQRYEGCAVTLSGNKKTAGDDWLPNFLYPSEGSEMYYRGWKADNEADGPDGTAFRIQNPDIFCLISGSWDGGLDDDPSYVPSDEFKLTVECAKKL